MSNGTTLLKKWELLQAIIRDPSLSASAKVVAARILDFYNTQTGRCCPSNQTLADGTCLKRRAVIYAVKELEERRWIVVERTKGGASGGDSRYATNSFKFDFERTDVALSTVHGDASSTVHVDAPLTVHEDAPLQACNSARNEGGTVHGDAPSTVHAGAPESGNNIGKETGKTPPTPSRFDEFWSAYPKKVAKDEARRAFNRILKDRRASPEELIAGAQRLTAERAGHDPKWTKHPASWLNAGCWADEPPPQHQPSHNPTSRPDAGRPSATAYLMARQARRLGHG